MKPTLAELEKISTEIYQYKQSAGDEFDSIELALKIHALLNPPINPLSELANSEEDCRKVGEYFLQYGVSNIIVEPECITIQGQCDKGEE